MYPSEYQKQGHMAFIVMELQCDLANTIGSTAFSLIFGCWTLRNTLIIGSLQLICLMLLTVSVCIAMKIHNMPAIQCTWQMQAFLAFCYAQMAWSLADSLEILLLEDKGI